MTIDLSRQFEIISNFVCCPSTLVVHYIKFCLLYIYIAIYARLHINSNTHGEVMSKLSNIFFRVPCPLSTNLFNLYLDELNIYGQDRQGFSMFIPHGGCNSSWLTLITPIHRMTSGCAVARQNLPEIEEFWRRRTETGLRPEAMSRP